ncbi:carbon-nitrogen hydrolase family protein [Salinarimonas ramus]|uniref:Amidohydrolase n=1 Tax=Salinarimonas ramus TaxID=690164 RepID=A0A917QB40_9HYPH|nr:carbon-nitrogen hydrolase family protein [Salinarimonas ramus]GGK40634.1 amidohydrolase [Salinarimonas ramus]
MSRIVVACVGMRSSRDPAANREAAIAGVNAAADAGAVYVQTPEMTALLERDRAALFDKIREEDADETIAALREVARRRGVTVHLGSLAIRVGEKVANRAVVIGPDGAILATYDKIHLFDVDLPNGETWRESNTYVGGDRAVIARAPLGEAGEAGIGVAICYDIRFPHLYRAYGEAGAAILTAPAAFTRQTGEAHWQVLARARAIENGAFFVAAAQGGVHEDGRETYGHSIIVDPWGRVLAEGDAEPGIVAAQIDLDAVAEARRRIPSLRHGRPFTLVGGAG